MPQEAAVSNVVILQPKGTAGRLWAPQQELADLLHATIFDQDAWPGFLRALSEQTGAHQAVLLFEAIGPDGTSTTLASNDGLIAVDANLNTDRVPAASALRAVIVNRIGVSAVKQAKGHCAVVNSARDIFLHLQRPWGFAAIVLTANGAKAGFTADGLAVAEALAPIFSQTIAATATLMSLSSDEQVQAGALQFFSGAVALVQGTGLILNRSPAWDLVFRRFPGIDLTHCAEWNASCREAVRYGPNVVKLRPGFIFRFSPICPRGNDRKGIVAAYAAERLVVEVLDHPGAGTGRTGLMAAFNMTGSEVDVLEKLCSGGSVAEIAASRNCSVETVRHHLKGIKRKTGVTRLPSLVALAATWL